MPVMAGGCCNVCGILGGRAGVCGRRRTRYSLHLEFVQGATFPAALVLHYAAPRKNYWVQILKSQFPRVFALPSCVAIF